MPTELVHADPPAPTLGLTREATMADWPKERPWDFALVNPVLDAGNAHPIAVAMYDESLDACAATCPDGSRAMVAFCKQQTTRDWLWRRGWADKTAEFVAYRDNVALPAEHKPTPQADAGDGLDVQVLAALVSTRDRSPKGVTPMYLSRALKLDISLAEAQLDAMVDDGRVAKSGSGAVVLYRIADPVS